MPENGTATATIVCTDVVGSSQVRARVGTPASDRLLPDQQRDLAEIATTHGGRVVKAASDGIMAAFDAASDAVMAAVAMQRHMDPTDVAIGVGAASGDVSWDGGACFGFPVVIATRLQDAASDGQILVSQVVRSLAGDRAGDRYTHLGSRALNGVAEPVDVFDVTWEPPEKTDGAIAPGVVPLPTELAVRPGFQFVGRAEEWEDLTATWSEVESGGRRVVLLSGEAGAGKTRLAFEFARQCHQQGAAVLFGGCDSELGVPYQPWVRAFGHLLGSLPDELLIDDLAPELSEVAVILPQLDRFVPGLLRSASVDPEIDRYRLFGAVDAMLAKASSLRPVVLVLDDLHWAGAQTLALLRHLARSGSAERLLLIGAFRDTADEITEPLASCLADLRRLDGVVRLRMDGFDRSHVERFVAMATSQDLDADMRRLAATVARRTAGNPFYVGELWRHLVATGAVVHSRNRWVARTDAGTVGVPESVREVVGARLARLSGPARSLIELVAVAGQRIELRVLALAAELSEPDLVVPLDELVEAGLLDAGGSTLLTYEFPHALVRDSVEETVPAIRRVLLHRSVAEAVEQVHEADRRPVLADLARHFAASAMVGTRDKALYYGQRAGAQAVRSAAFDVAISHFDRAIALAVTGTELRVELLLDLGFSQIRDGRYLESMQTCGTAFEDALELGDVSLIARAAVGFEQAVHMPGLPGAPAVRVVTTAMAMVPDDDLHTRARLQAALARAYAHAGRTGEALDAVDVALGLARRSNDNDALGAALEAALISTTDPLRSLSLAAELDELVATSTDPWHELYATASQLRALISLGRMSEAATVLDRHRAASERGRYPTFQFVAAAYEVVLLLASGLFDQAEAAAERAHALGSAVNSPFDEGVYGLQMFAIRREQGRLGEVAPVLKLVAERTDQKAMWRPGLAALYADLGLLDDARRAFEALALDDFVAIPRDSVWPACAGFLAEVCEALGDGDRAAVLYRELAAFRERNLMVGMTICFGPADRLLGNLAALLGRDRDAEGHYRVALELARRSESPLWEAHVLADHSRFLGRRGAQKRAAELGQRARQIAESLGMEGLAARARADLAAVAEGVGGDPVSPGPSLPDGLSAREWEVLELVATGSSNREIGEKLFISQNTVANHVRAILQKTGCANRTEAATYSARHHLSQH